jgi:hypothetical protein
MFVCSMIRDKSGRFGHLDHRPAVCFTAPVVFYGLVTWQTQSVVDFYLTREEAEATLRDVLHDEPGWDDTVGLVRL